LTVMETKAAEFQAAVRKQAGSGPRNRYTAALRAQAVEYGRARSAEGVSLESAARELSLAPKSLYKWSKASDRSVPVFQRVTVVADKEAVPRAVSPLVLHAPGGVRVEGLDVETLAALLRRLG